MTSTPQPADPPTDGPAPPTNGTAPPTNGPAPPTDGTAPPTDGTAPPTDGPAPPTNGPAPPTNGTACNGVTLSLLLAVAMFGTLGYRYGAAFGFWAGWGTALVGVALGVILTPLVFLLLMFGIHLAVKAEDRCRLWRDHD